MKTIKLIIALLTISTTLPAQMQTIKLNSQKLQFDDGRALPAEKSFIVNGDAGALVGMMKMQVSTKDFAKDKIVYETTWQRKIDDKTSVAVLPNLYKLKSGNEYFFRFLYYRKIMEVEKAQIKLMLKTTAKTLLESNIQAKDRSYKLLASPEDLYYSLNAVIEEGMVNYETKSGFAKPHFSGVIKDRLRTLSRIKISSDTANASTDNMFTSLLDQVNNEVDMIANNYQYVLNDVVTIPDYPVERKQNSLALNVGYAGVYNSGEFNNIDYFSGPYAGLSFPLGNRVFAGRFWNNSSISAGIFLKNFETTNNVEVSGPIVKKPLYVAYGYKVFNYLKLHAGAAVLEDTKFNNNTTSVYLKPFIGLSLEVNLWLGFDKKQ